MVLLLVGVRISFSLLPLFHERIVTYLNDQLDTDFTVDVLESSWEGITPSLTIRGLRLQGHEAERPAFLVEHLDLELNTVSSLLNFTPIISHLEVNGVDLVLESDARQRWSLSGVKRLENDNTSTSTFDIQKELQWLSKQEYIDLTYVKLELLPYNQDPVVFKTQYLSLSEDAGHKQLQWKMDVGDGLFELTAAGRGTRRWDMDWSGQLNVEDINVSRLCRLLDKCDQTLLGAQLEGSMSWGFQTGYWQFDSNLGLSDLRYSINGVEAVPGSFATQLQAVGYSQDSQVTDWNAVLANTRITSGDQQGVIERIEVHGRHQGETVINLAVDSLDLDTFKPLALTSGILPEMAEELVTTLNPTGKLSDISVRYLPDRDPLADGSIVTQAKLESVFVDAWGGVPSAGNISGWLNMNTLSGYLDVETKNFRLGFPKLFRDEWQYYSANTRLEWDVVDDIYRLKSDDITLVGDEGKINGKMVLDIPFGSRNDQPLYLNLDVEITDGDARHTNKYLPVHILDTDLVQWLEKGIKGAVIHQGGFKMEGLLEEGTDEELLWSLFFDIENGELEYDPDWPVVSELKGRVLVNNNSVKVDAERGKTYDTVLKNVSVSLPLDDELTLHLNGDMQSRGEDVIKFLTQTPLKDYTDGMAKDWAMQGELSGNLTLTLPLEDIDSTYVKVSATANNASFSIKSPDVKLTNIKGVLSFDTKSGLQAEQLEAVFLDEKIKGSIASEFNDKGSETLQVNWLGRAAADSLQHWLALDFLSLLEGASDYSAHLTLRQDGPLIAELSVKSQLLGMEIELPAPIGITAEEANPLDVRLNAYKNNNELFVRLGNAGRSHFQFDQEFDLDAAAISLGTVNVMPEMESGLIRVSGDISELNLGPWVDVFKGQPPAEDEMTLLTQIEIDNLTINKLIYDDYIWNDLRLAVKPEANFTEVTINSEPIDGQLLIPSRPTLPYSLDMKRLHLPDIPIQEGDGGPDDILKNIIPSELPSAIVKIESLKVGEKDLGLMSFIMQPLTNGKRVSDMKASLEGMSFTGSMDWLYINDRHETHYQGTLKGKRIDDFQRKLDLPVMVEAKDSRIDARLNWQGSPLNIDMGTLDGTLNLRLKNGSLKQLDGGAGALKLFGVFNTEAFVRRMKLDFSDLYSSGVSFDDLRGQLHFDKGIITFDQPLTVEGPSSNLKLDGLVNTKDKIMDLSLVVTLPVTSNLPMLSVLFGTAPQIAGIIYLADKLVGKQVDQLASIRYRINGSFDEPSVTLDQLFSNKAKKPDSK